MKYIIQDFMTQTVIATVESSREGKIDKLTASPAVTKAWNEAPLVGGGIKHRNSRKKERILRITERMKDTDKMDVWEFAEYLSRLDESKPVYVVKEDKR